MAQNSEEVAYEVALRRLDSQLQRVDIIETKVGLVLGLASTAIGIFAGFVAVVVDPNELASVIFAAVSGAVILIVYLFTMRSGLATFATTEWDQRPNWEELLVSARELDLPTMQLWVAEGCVLSLRQNEPQLRQKTKAAATATRLALIDVILVAVVLISLLIVNAAII